MVVRWRGTRALRPRSGARAKQVAVLKPQDPTHLCFVAARVAERGASVSELRSHHHRNLVRSSTRFDAQ